jgi:small-conductance mechanosensitive channel
MIFRVLILLGIPVFAFWLYATWRTWKKPEDTLRAAPVVGRWFLFIAIAVLLTVAVLGFLYTVEHQI